MQALRQQRPTVHVEHLKFFGQVRFQERTGSARSSRRDKQPDIQIPRAIYHRFYPDRCREIGGDDACLDAVPTTQIRCDLLKQVLTTGDQDGVQSRRCEPKRNFSADPEEAPVTTAQGPY